MEKDSVHSLLQYVEAHGERLRRKYLAWIHDLGEGRIAGKRVIDHLALEDGLSYWWMTLLVEKSPWKSPVITDVIRLLALEEIVAREKPGKLRLVSANPVLNEALKDFAQTLGIAYEWQRLPAPPSRESGLRRVYHALPYPVQALIHLARHLWERWPLRRAERSGWFSGESALFICSYFFNVAPDRAGDGHFHSRYWEGLHDLMGRLGLSGNWLQHYYPHGAVPTPRVALDWVRRFNQNRRQEGFHTFLESYLSGRIVFRVLRRWLRLGLASLRRGELEPAFRPQGGPLSLWPLMRREWYSSIRGPVAIDNLLWIELFDAALRELPHQEKGLYVCENQAWERAMIHAWRKHGHGKLIAVAHGTNRRFWDLRYFTDARTVRAAGPFALPQPNLIALNGKAAVDEYLSVDYPREAIVECEALRYGHLNHHENGRAARTREGNATRVLLLGDYIPSRTAGMLRLLESAAPHLSAPAAFTMKPHPNCMVEAAEYPSLQLTMAAEPLATLLHDFDVAYSSNMTSAAVDAYLAGLPVVVMLDEQELNFSPLRGQPGAHFVRTPEELAYALQTAGRGAPATAAYNEFFFLDPELPRWQKVLAA